MVQALRLAALIVLFASSAARAQQVPTCTITAAPSEALGSANVTLTWSSTAATTCVASGAWSGEKDCSGTAVMSGVNSTRTYTLSAKAATGKAVARWTKVTQNQDGTPATITGYRIYIADAPSGLPSATAINLPVTPLEYTFWRSPGDVSVGMKAVRSDSVDSNLSNVQSKDVVAAATSCKATVTIAPRPKAPSLTLTLTWLKELFTGTPDES